MIGRASIVFLALLWALAPLYSAAQPIWPNSTWITATPESLALSPTPLETLDAAIRTGHYGNVDRLVVAKGGYLVLSQHYERNYDTISAGHSGALGCGYQTCTEDQEDDPYNYFHPNTHPYYYGRAVHSLQSVTKSVAATVIGIALTKGAIDSLGVPLLSFFQEYNTQRTDPRLRQATLEDLLTMRTGIEWHEQDRPLDHTNTTLQLEQSEDWIQFTLNQPSDAAPGERWVYNSGGSHLMSGVIKSATGLHLDAYAQAHLFGPLQVLDHHWKKTPQGFADTEGGLYLEAEQLAKIGLLYLRGGEWNGQRIIDESFVHAATARQVIRVNSGGWGYGYQWWRLDRNDTVVWAALGFGGQALLVLPAHDLIGVVNAWNVFGARTRNMLGDFLDALILAATD